MLAASQFHKLFFFVSALLAMNSSTFSETMVLDMDLDAGTGRIALYDLSTMNPDSIRVEKSIAELRSASAFSNKVKGAELDLTMVRKMKGDLRMDIFFNITDQKALLKSLSFQRTDNGGLRFRPGKKEELLSSNGSENEAQVSWTSNASKIHLKLQGKFLDEAARKKAVKLEGGDPER